MASFDDEESHWNSSKIKGFSFGDDEEVRSTQIVDLGLTF